MSHVSQTCAHLFHRRGVRPGGLEGRTGSSRDKSRYRTFSRPYSSDVAALACSDTKRACAFRNRVTAFGLTSVRLPVSLTQASKQPPHSTGMQSVARATSLPLRLRAPHRARHASSTLARVSAGADRRGGQGTRERGASCTPAAMPHVAAATLRRGLATLLLWHGASAAWASAGEPSSCQAQPAGESLAVTGPVLK